MTLLLFVFSTLWVAVSHLAKPDRRLRNSSSSSLSDIAKISTREEFFSLCGKIEDNPQNFMACREKLPILATSFIWVDRKFLVRAGRNISPEDLDVLYGISGKGAESARLTITSALLARCRRGAPTKAGSFQELIDQDCIKRLPTLAELGMEIDPEWAGTQMVNSTYDGRMKLIYPEKGPARQ